MSMQKQAVEKYIKDNSDVALNLVSSILNKNVSMQSFNGIIGGKNKTYDTDALNYKTPEEYIEAWKQSHQGNFDSDKNALYKKSSHKINDLLQNPIVEKFIENYLARTYFKKHAK